MNMNEKDMNVARRALATAICCDIVSSSVTALGKVNTTDGSKTKMIVFDEVIKATTKKD